MQIALRHALIPQLIWLKAADIVSLGMVSSRPKKSLSWDSHVQPFTLEQSGYSALCSCRHSSSVRIRNHVCACMYFFPNCSVLCFVHGTALPCGSELTATSHRCFDFLCVNTQAFFGGTPKSLACARHAWQEIYEEVPNSNTENTCIWPMHLFWWGEARSAANAGCRVPQPPAGQCEHMLTRVLDRARCDKVQCEGNTATGSCHVSHLRWR